MYNIIKHSHSGLMWLILLSLAISLAISIVGMTKKGNEEKPFPNLFYKISKWLIYLQVLLGISLLFVSPKVQYVSGFMKIDALRFYGMEHPLIMIISVGLMSMGLVFAKKKDSIAKKHRTVFIFYGIAALLISYMIPWSAVFSA